MRNWLVRLTAISSADGIEAHFIDVIDAYSRIEEQDDRLLDCSWSLEHEPGSQTASIEIAVTIAEDTTVEVAIAAIRTAIHEAGGFTPGWSSDPSPETGAPFTAELEMLQHHV